MASGKNWSQWWRRFLDLGADESTNAVDVLTQRYVGEMQSIERFMQHADKMRHPQYRAKFLQMIREKTRHAESIGDQIVALGGRLPMPDVAERRSTDGNSWQSLAMALDEENRSADLLPKQLRSIESEHADIAEFLQKIAREQANHRDEIRDMLMRSAFA
jgi:bacterioferritin (cytochrome b1)